MALETRASLEKVKATRSPLLCGNSSCSEARGAAGLLTLCWPPEIVCVVESGFRAEAEVSLLCWSRAGAQQVNHVPG